MRRILVAFSTTPLQRRVFGSCNERGLVQRTCEHIYCSSSAREELRQLIHESSVENALRHLGEFSRDVSLVDGSTWLEQLSRAPDVAGRIAVILSQFERWYVARKAPEKVTMHEPWDWYPKARFMRRRFIFHYGPTNSGKTHAALEALVKAKSGVYCAPLKALAAQVWKRIDARVPCDLLIGDERRFGGGAEHVSCTVEMTPIDYQIDVGVIDEVQMIADRDRGWAWTRALLGLPAREIHLCGEERAIPLIRNLLYKTRELPRVEVVPHKRLVPLEVSPSLDGDLRRIENGDTLVCFSRRAIFDMKKKLENIPGVVPHCIYGSMPFSVRESQADAFNNGVRDTIEGKSGKRHVLISTDAIAYGLNMSIERIIFTSMRKFDGKQMTVLPQATALQVAGRAGRFGVMRSHQVGRCTTLDSNDFALLCEAVSSRLPPLQKAGLLPTADVLELYIRLRGVEEGGRVTDQNSTSFYRRMREFSECCQASELFFPCDLSRSLLQVARELEAVTDLSLSDRILFCYVPLNDRGGETCSILRAFACDHAAGREVLLRIDEDFERLAKQCDAVCSGDERRAQQVLTRMEHLYRAAEMYCWLAWRFVITLMGFVDFSLCFWRLKKRGDDDGTRTVRPGCPLMEYCDNTVKSSKYTLLTFLPMNLFEQFHRPINLYFLLLTALQFTPSVAPVSPFTSLLPLTIAFLITAIKEGIDDWYRHRLDDECNSRWYSTINMETLQVERVRCRDIRVGAVLLLLPMEVVPCDVVLLLSSGENGEVVISTEALDGETVCKKRYAILSDIYAQRPTTSAATMDSVQEEETNIRSAAEFIRDAACSIESEGPKPFLNSFTGAARVKVPHDTEEEVLIGVSAENVAFNSSVLRNTRFALGVAMLTGNETRVAMTRTAPPTKWSLIDQRFNQMVIVVFVIQFILVIVYVSLSDTTLEKDQRTLWYLGMYEEQISLKEYILLLPLRFFSLVSPMVPLSFKVMVDASKAFISVFIKWDEEMSDENCKTEVHNSSLMEDLGRVEYVLTDKTGTLTRNMLTLKTVVATSGKAFTPGIPHEASAVRRALRQDESLLQLMRVLVYCNTVESTRQVTLDIMAQTSAPKSPPSSAWASPSPDEVALVEGATALGVKLLERKRKRAFVMFGNNVESVTVLKVLSFTPERRRLSVLLQIDGDLRVLLLTKGSDESVLPRCIKTSYDRKKVSHTLNRLSSEGLRTLVSAYRYLTSDEAELWLADVRKKEAITTAAVRAVSVSQAYASVEKELIYCGITAVEDQLQDDVSLTITQLRSAGVRVWMLTGDKSQTAKQTAIASGLVGPDDRVIVLAPEDVDSMSVEEHLDYVERRVNYALRKRQFQESERRHEIHSSWYVRSGLRDFVEEFLHHDSILSFLYHPSHKSLSHDRDEYFSHENVAENEQQEVLSRTVTRQGQGYVILFSGKTIELLQDCGNEKLLVNFKRVLLHASTVICSRMAPEQKSFVVRTVKKAGHVTLAIGDGGNDVSMIQSAHVGVGMRGREGTQATAASDVVVSQFCFLSRLLLFHGHTAYQRSAIIVQQSFWKTVALAWMQLLFNIYTKFSGVSFWDSFSLMMYNSFFTVPVTFLCALNLPLSASMLLNNPQLYVLCQRGRYLNVITFYGYVFRGFLHGTFIFFLALGFLDDSVSGIMRLGHTKDRTCDFYVSCFALVTLHSCIILLETHSITFLHWMALIWSVASLFVLFTLYGVLSENYSFLELLKNLAFYLQWIVVVAVPFVTLSVYSAIKLFFFPDVLQLQRLTIDMISKAPFLSHLWPFWVDENPSGFWRSFSVCHLCRDKSSAHCGTPSVGTITSVDLQVPINAEQESGEAQFAGTKLDSIRDSTALSEPLIKRM